ncbi:MAG: bifunctional YncE family protein/alkaline phosphatase family protein, partial [Bryobacteraceae bacterium]
MTRKVYARFPLSAAGLMLALVVSGALAQAQPDIQALPNMGQQITPLAPPDSRFESLNPDLADRPDWLAGQAATSVVSPDRKTLLVLTSGYNRVFALGVPPPPYPWSAPDSNEYVFIYDISTPAPVKTQVVQIANSYHGMVFDPSGTAFYVAGGQSDVVHIFTRSAAGTWAETTAPLALGHNGMGVGLNLRPNGAVAINSQVGVAPCAAGVAISSDGQTLVVANYYNDSITVFTGGLGNWSKLSELDLRPGKSKTDPRPGMAGGEYPFWVVVKGNGPSATAYVSSIRDREIVVVSLSAEPEVRFRIPVTGQPNKMTLNAAQTLLYVAEDQSDTVDVIDTATNAILASIPVIVTAPGMPAWLAQFKGANPNSVALSPDETQLWVTNGTLNCIAVVALDGPNGGGHVVGLIPTGWYPNSVSLVSFRGPNDINTVHVYVVNAKSPTGANPEWCYGGGGPPNSPNCEPSNQYNPQRTKAGLQSFPLPSPAQLATLTEQVAVNNRFSHTESDEDLAVMAAVRQGIKHVIFIIKENRTYDQILGDLKDAAGRPMGDGDPTLTEFGEAITPNHHSLARNFVTLDNFLCTAEVSYDGWSWSTSAQAPDVVEHQFPVAYAARGLSLDGG